MAFAHAYGTCPGCKGRGALWSRTIMVKRFWLFGPLVPHKVYRCDECDARGKWPASTAHQQQEAAGHEQ